MSDSDIYLFINLGTPDAPTPAAVGKYLDEFLMDPAVIDVPRPIRDILVKALIVPRRKFQSAEAYQKIWSQEGSPLLYHSQSFVNKMQSKLPAALAMRYGNPSIYDVIKGFAKKPARIYVVPMYPQYATSSTGTALDALRTALQDRDFQGEVLVLESFYDEEFFIKSYAEQIRRVLRNQEWDHLLFSYHGLPMRHLKRLRAECGTPNCCSKAEADASRARFCYKFQCHTTTLKIAKELKLELNAFSMAFQSRLGPGWIQPFTDKMIQELPGKGVQNLVVVCPSFVADCLETLEEIRLRAKLIFLEAGGHSLTLVPCLNSEDHWVEAFLEFLQSYKSWRPL